MELDTEKEGQSLSCCSPSNYDTGDGQFYCILFDVAFDTGGIFVRKFDSSNHCIKVFMPERRFVRAKGRGEGKLKWPSSVSIDS